MIYKNSQDTPKDSVRINQNLTMIEKDGELYGLPDDEISQSYIHRGYIEKDACLEEILQINEFSICKLSDESIIKINKNKIAT